MRIERLEGTHDLEHFVCGRKELDDWLRRHALENQERNLTRTFLLIDDTDEILGYYSLTMGGVKEEDLPFIYRGRLPRYAVGMVLLARFAISLDHQGEGLGRDLLVEAIRQAALAGESAAARFIAVDPIDACARDFYEHFGFRLVPDSHPERMFIRIDEVLLSLF